MRNLTRKEFLKTMVVSGTGLAAMGLVGCSSSDSTSSEETVSENSTEETSASTESAGVEEQTVEVDTTRQTTADSDGRAEKIVVALNADPTELAPHSPNNQNKG